MKILKLNALNINSLKGKVKIDFLKFLQGNSLFAIIGETGSGKTTILDIISCALYGQTPRLSNPKDLISKGTGEAFCEVEFEVKGKIYRSSWSIKRARKKADGAIQTPKMELSLVKSGKILSDKSRDVPKKVEEITGLDFGRFTQSMMLAQGGFDAFLKAKEKDRSALLEKLTGTKIYSQISQKVYENYKNIENNLDKERALIEGIELLSKEKLEEINSTLLKLNSTKESLDKELSVTQKELKVLEDFESLQKEQLKAKQEYKQSKEALEQNRNKFKELELAKKAFKLDKSYTKLESLKSEIKLKSKNLDTISLNLERLNSQKIDINSKLNSLKEYLEKNSNLSTLNRDLSLISELVKSYTTSKNELIKSKAKIEKLEDDLKRKEIDIKAQEAKLKPLKEEFEKIDNKLKKAQELSQTLDKQEPILNREKIEYIELKRLVIEYIDTIKKYKALKVEIESLNKEQQHFLQLKDNLQNSLNSIKAHIKTLKEKIELELLIKKYEDDRKKLKEGEPCFLCGSKVHPLVKEYESISPNKSQLEQKEQEELLAKTQNEYLECVKKLEGLNSNILNKKDELNGLEARGKELKAYFEQKEFKLTNDNSKIIEERLHSIELKLEEISQARDSRAKAQNQKDSIKLKLEAEQNSLISLQNSKLLLKEQLKSINSSVDNLSNLIKENEVKLKSFWSKFDLEFNENSLDSKLQILKNRALEYENSKNKEINLQKGLSNIDTKLESEIKLQKSIKKELDSLNSSLQELSLSFDRELKECEFNTIEEFLKAYKSSQEIELLEKFCQNLEQEFKTKEALLESIEQKLKSFKDVDLSKKEALVLKAKELKEQLLSTQEEVGRLTQIVEGNRKNQDRVKDKLKEIDKLKQDYEVWVKLNELIGSADGAKFAKFAQGITLDNLIYLANSHLEILTNRYYIVRRKEQNHLLELDIVDRYQGNDIRSTNTLSGGESFLISLSLALGLSELASQKISIDSLFLDEGFGTLDKESLEIVLDALSRLESRGKMVGIISHVEALKEHIPLQIKVKKVGGGVSMIEEVNML